MINFGFYPNENIFIFYYNYNGNIMDVDTKKILKKKGGHF